MSAEHCPKCGARPAHIQNGCYHCMMCGKDWPVSGAVLIAPITIKDVEEKKEKIMEDQNRKKPCKNCERVMVIQSHGMCGACNGSVKGLAPGSPEYLQKLAETKTRVTDRNYKGHGNRHTIKKQPKILSPEKIKKIKTHVKALQLKSSGEVPADMALVIASMEMQRDSFMASADKIQKAIDILRS